MNVKEYDDADTLDTEVLYKFLEHAFGKKLKDDHTIHGGFGTYIESRGASNNYMAFTLFKNFDIDEDYKNAVYLSKIAVCPASNGNGVGKKILGCAIDLCETKGYGVVYFRADKNNTYLSKNEKGEVVEKPIGEYYKQHAKAEKIADAPELYDGGGEIYKIVLDETKAAEIDDSLYIEKIKKLPEDFYRKEIPFDDGST